MVPFAVLALWSCAPVRPLDAADTRALEHVISAVSQLEYDVSTRRFERAAPKALVQTWRRIQARLSPTHRGYPSIAFALAFYHVDYGRNIERMLAQFRIANRAYGAHERPNLPPHYEAGADEVPTDLDILYGRFHDALSLGKLMDLRTDGYTAEAQDTLLYDIWRKQPDQVLLTASRSKTRQYEVARMLDFSAAPIEEPADYRRARRTLLHCTRSSDLRIAHTAAAVRALLRQRNSYWR